MQTDMEGVFRVNIICNNCVGAVLYKQKNIKFNNPFMWSLVSPNDFIYLINNFDSLDLSKVEVTKPNKILVDSRIEVAFPHYKKADYDTPTVIGSNVFFKDISRYMIDKWNSRLSRMDPKESPTFVISDRKNATTNGKFWFNDLTFLSKIETNYRVVFAGVKCDMDLPENITFVKIASDEAPIGRIAEILIERKIV